MYKKQKIKPVRKVVVPKYPDKYSVDVKGLLLENKPVRWNGVPAAGIALSAVVMMGLAGCDINTGVTTSGEIAPPKIPTPLFEHGDGIGVYGCVSVAAPVFLSEDDAFAVISDEFSKSNLSLTKSGAVLPNIQIPDVDLNSGNGEELIKTQKGTLDFDFSVDGTNVHMEYVSSQDMEDWSQNGSMSTVTVMKYKDTAKALNDSLNDSYSGYAHGVFYDPGESAEADGSADTSYEQLQEEAQARAKEALRAQVRDFLDWLFAQGII